MKTTKLASSQLVVYFLEKEQTINEYPCPPRTEFTSLR